MDAHERRLASIRQGFDGCADRRGRPAALRRSVVGFRLSRPLRRVLARARQSILGRLLRGDRLSAAARGFAAQGLVPDDRHGYRRHNDRGADRVLSAGSDRLSRAPGPMGCYLRLHRHPAAQLRVLLSVACRLYGCDYRRRRAWRDRRRKLRGLLAGGLARQRDLHRNRVRRHRPRRDRPRRRQATAGSVTSQSRGRDRGPIYTHAGTGGAATAGHANRATRVPPAGHRARTDDRSSARRVQSCALPRVDIADCRPRPVRSARWLERSCGPTEPRAGRWGSAGGGARSTRHSS